MYLYIFLGTWASTVYDNVSNQNMIALISFESDQYRWFDFFLFPQKKRDCPEDEKRLSSRITFNTQRKNVFF